MANKIVTRVALATVGGLATVSALWATGPTDAAADPSHFSVVDAGPDSTGANLRSCPGLPNQGQTTGCGVITVIPNGTSITMVCWIDGNPPSPGTSPRWFWVRDGAGQVGYMWSDLVAQQQPTPFCTDELTAWPATPSPSVILDQGAPVDTGYRYNISLSNFAPQAAVLVECFDSVDSTIPFYTFTSYTDGAGSAVVQDQCWSSDGPSHWVIANGMTSTVADW
ncbi:SH3 domain-containing protein [Modestobacter sp. VKM Ac-2979]|uniref:SH3 domain-containing protein n=1 Tax=unclassified Modestobacter TaxID=2643866 RepID=UPI0022ABA0A6|nr:MULTISPECIES: SH3 domain-containing protein [unclassified Modestobacter]MCZ2813714.1 SH3 domain-containing protein [Modestobacter sp. VKM Ac-2979]MCZ2844311.1 SH3 domain-containing protein [Modestobacter sp. VKM Ac-2980]